jgi:DNA-binding NtrC family response regulator
MQRLLRDASRVAQRRVAVTINGEPGSGKLLLTQLMHEAAGSVGSLHVVHCARPPWSRDWRRAVAAGGTIVLHRVHALSTEDQLELADELDDLPSEDRPWVIGLLNSRAPAPCDELLVRIAPVSLSVPPLRERGHDLWLLVEHWCDARERSEGARPVVRGEALEALAAQPWPGNVRELRNALDAAALRAGSIIGVDALRLGRGEPAGGRRSTGSLREIERDAISGALERNGGNVTRAAKELGIGRATLHRRLRAYRLLSPAAGDDGSR